MLTRQLRNAPAALAEAAAILRRGGLVVFPTETVYGLGARAFDARAARAVYRAKGRPADNPLIVHVADEAMLRAVTRRVTPLARRLIDAFWPGPLTLVLDKSRRVPSSVTAGAPTVAVRMPAHPAARALLRALGEPIAAPSANRSGRPSPTSAAHALKDLRGRVPLVLDGGPCAKGLESTIVDARGDAPVLLRPGSITAEALAKAAGRRVLEAGRAAPAAQGTRHRHYAPSCQVVLVPRRLVRSGLALSRGDGLIRRGGPAPRGRWSRLVPGSVTSYARELFAALREAEGAGVRRVFVETVPDRGVGRAVMDRLRRASAA